MNDELKLKNNLKEARAEKIFQIRHSERMIPK